MGEFTSAHYRQAVLINLYNVGALNDRTLRAVMSVYTGSDIDEGDGTNLLRTFDGKPVAQIAWEAIQPGKPLPDDPDDWWAELESYYEGQEVWPPEPWVVEAIEEVTPPVEVFPDAPDYAEEKARITDAGVISEDDLPLQPALF